MSDSQQPIKIVVEVVSHADVKRLEARDEDLREEINSIARKMEGLHRTFYEYLEALGGNRRK